MKRLILVAMLVLVSACASYAEDAAEPAPSGIPTPPGAKVTMEMNVDRDQIVTQLNSILSIQGGSKAPKIDESALRQALGSLERVAYSQMSVSGKRSAIDTLALFEREVGGRRIVWSVDGKPGTGLMLLATPDGGYFGAQLTPIGSSSGRPAELKIMAFRTVGFIDVAKAVKLALPILFDMGMIPGAHGK